MSGNRMSRMHGPLVRYDDSSRALLGEVARGAEQYIQEKGLPVPRSVRKKPMDEYWVFLPNRGGYENVATHYVFRYPKSCIGMDGNRFVIRTHNYSHLSAITGVLHVGKYRRQWGKKTLQDYFDQGLDVVKASDVTTR